MCSDHCGGNYGIISEKWQSVYVKTSRGVAAEQAHVADRLDRGDFGIQKR
jgi:hypothetical protein